MLTVHEVSRMTGVSIRALHYYDQIGLLHPAKSTDAGYRLYDDTELERLQQILLFRELEFPLKEIKKILDSPNFDKNLALDQQITLLKMKKEHLERLIDLALETKKKGADYMDFSAFDTQKIEEYTRKAKETWGHTEAFQEYGKKAKIRSQKEEKDMQKAFMELFVEFGKMKKEDPTSEAVQAQVKKLQDYITDHFYTCTNEILQSLGEMYVGDNEFTENIDRAGGEGTAQFVAEAIKRYQ